MIVANRLVAVVAKVGAGGLVALDQFLLFFFPHFFFLINVYEKKKNKKQSDCDKEFAKRIGDSPQVQAGW